MNKMETILTSVVCRLSATIRELKKENQALKNKLDETQSALIAAEIRENDLCKG